MRDQIAMPPIAVVAGHICLDIIPEINTPSSSGAPLIVPGKLTHIGPASIATGGAVSNTGLALHRLGIKTRLMGKIGSDLFGRAILDILSARDPQLAAGMIVDPASPSSYTVVLSAPGFDRSFLHCEGANDTFCAADVESTKIEDATLFHFGYPPIMRRIYADGGVGLAEVMQGAKGLGIATSLDTAHVDVDAPAGQVDWRAYLSRVLPYTDFFMPSLDEVFFMLDRQRFQGMTQADAQADLAAQGSIGLLRELVTTLLEMGAAVVALKMGDQGIYLRTTPDEARWQRMGKLALPATWRNRELVAPAFLVEVVGTTGAGDCAVAGLLAAALRGLGPEDALNAAVGAGACNVEVADATSGIPTWDSLQTRITAGWPRRPLHFTLDSWRQDSATGLWHSPADPG